MDIKIVFELLSIFPGTAEGEKKWGGTLKRNSPAVLPYESSILGKVRDPISPPKINISEPRFKSYDP